MMRFVIVAAVAAIGAVAAARVAERVAPGAPEPARAAVVLAAESPSQPAAISKSVDGHYWTWAEVDGHPVRFLVDTGATAVALTADDARRLGYDPASLDYRYSVSTANGQARAAEVKLASVSVSGARVDDVEAFVLDHGLPASLLGMTYLGRLSAFEATPTTMILRP
ncbi:MAG TPA: TIGR02281 family clan AA aspartic protease [Caulobacteraceae bacterium]|nr:TIGR02281 family clan AA aspartic protease [Caulobacteraceae bacterium]